MTDGFQHVGPTDRERLDDAERLVVHVEADAATRAAVTAAITERDGATDVLAVESPERAAELLATLPVDCVVVGAASWMDVLDATAAPVVLHTDADPANLDAAALEAADTLVERGGDGPPTFLARKVHSVLGEDSDRSRTQYARANALDRAERGDDGETHQFVVDDDGRLVWSSAPFEAVFPVDGLATDLPDVNSFDDRLRALLADSPGAIPTVTRTKRGEAANRRESFTVRTEAGEHHFVHTGYRLPAALGGDRLEVFEHVTSEVRRSVRAERLELLVGAAKDGLYTLDAQGNIDFCNAAFAEMLGYDRGELVGRHASSVLVEGELERGQAHVQQLIADDELDSVMVDMTFRDRYGERLEVAINFTLLPSPDDTYAGLMGVARDITERKERERELKQYRRLVEAAQDPMFVLDAEGRVTLYNDALERVVDTEGLADRPLTALFAGAEGERIAAGADGLRPGEDEWEQYEIRLTDRAGEERLYEATIGILDDDGFAGIVGTLRDVTQRNRRTYELDLLKQVLTRVLRHNIRSQLTVVQSHAAELAAGTADPAVAGAAIQETADALLSTTEKAREIEQLVERDRGRVRQDLAAVVAGAVGSVDRAHDDWTVTVDVPAVAVTADPALETALENVVENAVVHADAPSVTVTAAVSEDRVELRIADDGPGIPETELATLEQHEETPLRHSNGIGLWLIDRIVDHSGGELDFETDEDGTTVRLTLDRAKRGSADSGEK